MTQEAIRHNHPMQAAEEVLCAMGFKRSPIKGFSETADVDRREVFTSDPLGVYYQMGVDLPGRHDLFQVIFADDRTELSSAVLAEIEEKTGYRLADSGVLPCATETSRKFFHAKFVGKGRTP